MVRLLLIAVAYAHTHRASRRPSYAAAAAAAAVGGGGGGAAAAAAATVTAALQNGEDVERATGPPPQAHRVAMLGASGVGKSALTSQFLSSDHMNTYDAVGKEGKNGIELL